MWADRDSRSADGVPSDLRLRLWGLTLEAVGVITVWRDLVGTADRYGSGNFIASTRGWLKRAIGPRVSSGSVGASLEISSSMTGRLKVRRNMDATAPVESRLAALERNVEMIDSDMEELGQSLSKRATKIDERVTVESQGHAASIQDLKTELKSTATAHVSSLAFGTAWLGVGIVISTCAPEIARLVAGQWRAVWQAL